jgi:hypothetical protein
MKGFFKYQVLMLAIMMSSQISHCQPMFMNMDEAKRQYIQQNLEIYFIADPKAKPAFVLVPIVKILQEGTKFLAGSDNGMSKSAMLIDALFKTDGIDPSNSISNNEKPDLRFQETIYEAMMIKPDQKFKLYLMNDATSWDEPSVKKFNVYYKSNPGGYRIWPGAFSEKYPYAGSVVMSEGSFKSTMRYNKEMLISLLCQAALEDFGPGREPIIMSMQFGGSESDEVPVMFACSDARRYEKQGIANAFVLYYSDREKSDVFNWYQSMCNVFLPLKEVNIGIKAGSDDDVNTSQQRYSLLDRYNSMDQSNKSSPLPDYPSLKDFASKWVAYSSYGFKVNGKENPEAFRWLNDMYLGIYFYQFIRAFDIIRFVQAIHLNNNSVITVKPGLRTFTLIQNMTNIVLKGRNAAYIKENPGTDEAKASVFPIAALIAFAHIGFNKTDPNLLESLRKVTYAPVSDVSDDFKGVLDLYQTYWRPKILASLKEGKDEYDDGYMFRTTSQIARILDFKLTYF